MDVFFQASGAVLITVVLCLAVGSQNKSFSILLAMLVCTMVLLVGMRYLESVAMLLEELASLGNLPEEMMNILLKTALIGILTEICALLCADGGNASLGQSLRIVGTAVMLWLSVPVFRGLIELVQKILEGI